MIAGVDHRRRHARGRPAAAVLHVARDRAGQCRLGELPGDEQERHVGKRPREEGEEKEEQLERSSENISVCN